MACQAKASGNITWTLLENTCSSISFQLFKNNFDVVVLAAGAGMFQNDPLLSLQDFPVDLIRGQSIEMKLPASSPPKNDDSSSNRRNRQKHAALLCGKYISPLFDKQRVLIGATHEWSSTAPLSTDEVIQDLRQRTIDMAPFVWKHGEIANVTIGYRVQSRRGSLGRLPIIGRLHDCCTGIHKNVYIFTGLSSRGLLYHGLYGDLLTDMILGIQQHESGQEEYNLDWWRTRVRSKDNKV
jgi:glycine/D-amino acid oxidase-like deaminating enzyme